MSIVPPTAPVIPALRPFPWDNVPYTNVTPLTFRDAATMQWEVEKIKAWIRDDLVPHTDEQLGSIVESWVDSTNVLFTTVNEMLSDQAENVNNALDAQATSVNTAVTEKIGEMASQLSAQNLAVADQLANYDVSVQETVTNLTTYVNDQVATIIGETIEITDPIMTAIQANPASNFAANQQLNILTNITKEAIAGLQVVNFDKLSRSREKLNRASETLFNLVILGDSISEGVGSDDTSDSSSANATEKMRERAYPVIVRKRFAARDGIPANHNLMLLTSRGGWATPGYPTSATLAPYGGMFPSCTLGNPNTSLVIPASNTAKFTTLDVYYWGIDSGVSAARIPGVKIDDVQVQAPGTVNEAGNLLKMTFAGLNDSTHKIELFTGALGGCYPAYVVTRRGSAGVTVNRIAVAGAKTADAVGSNQRNIDSAVMKGHSSLVAIMLGTNDQGAQVPLATYKANLQSLINAALAGNADVLLLGAPPAAVGTTLAIKEDEYRATMIELSNENDHVAYADTRVLFGNNNRAAAYAAGLFPTSLTVHPSRLGHEKLGNALFDLFSITGIADIN